MTSKLEQERLVRKFSRAKVANDLNVHPNTLMEWEINPGKVKYENAIALADYYQTSLQELFSDV